MPWYLPIADNIKKRACRYLLQRYLGQFLEEKLTLDQLTVDLYNGTGTVCDVSLDSQALNELCASQGLPVEVVGGSVGSVSVSIPWSAPLSADSYVEVTGLQVTLRPRARGEDGTSMLESMWSSMSSSMQLAQDCLEKETGATKGAGQPLEGLELVAQTIDSILSRIKVRLVDSIIRLEQCPEGSSTFLAVQINIKNVEYLDEAGSDPPVDSESNKTFVVSSFTSRYISFEGITLYTDETHAGATNTTAPDNMYGTPLYETHNSPTASTITESRSSDTFYMSCDNKSFTQDEFKSMQPDKIHNDNDAENDNGNIFSTEPVLFAKLTGRQEIRIKMKQSEAVIGPKVQLELTMGSLACFLSPRQLLLLLEIAKAMATPTSQDNSNKHVQRLVGKPMTASDYRLVENDLQSRLGNSPGSGGLSNGQGWSTSPLDDSDNDAEFLPFRGGHGGLSDSISSVNSSVMSSSVGSSISQASRSSCQSQRLRRKGRSISGAHVDSDSGTELSHFSVRLASIAIVLLHEDILTLSGSSNVTQLPHLSQPSIEQLRNTAEGFFTSLGLYSAFGAKDFTKATANLDKACTLNHLRLLAAPIIIEGQERRGVQGCCINASLTAARLHLQERLPLQGCMCVPLLEFPEQGADNGAVLAPRPQLSVKFKQSQRALSRSGKRLAPTRTDIAIALAPCLCEVDITIVDRISALLAAPLWSPVSNPGTAPLALPPTKNSHPKYDIKLNCDRVEVRFRFPLVDMRPAHDPLRPPWWHRSVQPDFLTLVLSAVTVTHIEMQNDGERYEIQCRDVIISYTESEGEKSICVGRAGPEERPGMSSLPDGGHGFDWPRMVLDIYPTRKGGSLDSSSESDVPGRHCDPMMSSIGGALGGARPKEPSPFSAKRVLHESDTPHSKKMDDAEELIIPGDKSEMSEFCELSTRNSKVQIELFLPCVSLQLLSKHLYEVIYNRINTDLLLWEPNAPPSLPPCSMGVPLGLQESVYPAFAMCKSGIHYDSDSSMSDVSEGVNEIPYYSTYDRRTNKCRPLTSGHQSNSGGQSTLSLTLNIGQGLLTMCSPVRDSSDHVIPGQQGEFVVRTGELFLFTVSGYRGDADLAFLCVQASGIKLNHCGLISVPSVEPPLRLLGSLLPRHLEDTIYPTPVGAHPALHATPRGARDMLSVALRIQACSETKLKRIRVAAGLQGGSLRHRTTLPNHTWLTQLIDLFDVQDYPVPGYEPSTVVTEMHLHLWDCAVDYRPLHLPLRSMLTLGSFTMSSNITAQSPGINLRFIAEDCALLLACMNNARVQSAPSIPVDSYICVVELGLFELSLRINDKSNGLCPHIDLRASNNALHVRTCADSGRALAQLIAYIAAEGDLETTQVMAQGPLGPIQGSSDSLLIGDESNSSDLSRSQEQHVNDLMAEAMQESLRITSAGSEEQSGDCVEVFFFPDETQTSKGGPGKQRSHLSRDLGTSPKNKNRKSSDTDEEFCIVGNEAGIGVAKNGRPEIRLLTQDPLRIVDNHFEIPSGKADLLKPPKDFPMAVLRYTLCEMTLVWHLYGGNDFNKLEPKDIKRQHKTVTINEGYGSIGDEPVAFSKSIGGVNITRTANINNPYVSWKIKGGPERRHDILIEVQLNKVQFTHETYPPSGLHASRQVLLVSEVEVRDRLAVSQINKFLYQYTSEQRPKQSHAKMVVIKALHIRPDPKLLAQECNLHVSILPLRLNIDQDSLLFLIQFFNEIGGTTTKPESIIPVVPTSSPGSRHSTPTHIPPVMTVERPDTPPDPHRMVSDNLMLLMEDDQDTQSVGSDVRIPSDGGEDVPVYFRTVVFSPDVPIRLDYQGKRVELSHGPLAGLLMGLGQLHCSELRLKRITHRHGILGFEKLFNFLLQEWLQDVKKCQLPSLLGGVGPMHSLVQLFQGVRDLFWLPIEQYQKDGRIVRGLQRGANSFTACTALAALELTTRIIHLIQATAETAYDMVSPGPSLKRGTHRHNKRHGRKGRHHLHPPQDIREGVANAYQLVKEGINETACTIVRVASIEHSHKGVSGAVGGVLRQIPPTVVAPLVLATQATHHMLGGVTSQLVPNARQEAKQKWRMDESQ